MAGETIGREFTDYAKARENIYQSVVAGITKGYPVENNQFRLELSDLEYGPEPAFTLSQQKDAILKGASLMRPLKGTWSLVDRATGGVTDRSRKKVLDVPWMTPRGTFIHRGNEYVVSNQSRLKPGVYTRVKSNGEVEAHFNFLPGGGTSFRITIDPESGVFKMQIGGAFMPLYPILRNLGVPDERMKEVWGDEIFRSNMVDDPRVVVKALARLGGARAALSTGDAVDTKLGALFDRWKLDPLVTSTTLGAPFDRVSSDAILSATRRVLAVEREEEEPDERDSLAFQHLHSVEDFFGERIEKDGGRIGRRLLWKATQKQAVRPFESGALTPQVLAVLLSTGLGMSPEEINVIDLADQGFRVIRLGEGGISSVEAVPEESRHVHVSQFGFIDPAKGPESAKIGVDTRLTHNTRKGPGGEIYSRMLNARTGLEEWLTPEDALSSTIAFPGELKKGGSVRAVKRGKLVYVNPGEVDYELESPADMLTVTTNLIPITSSVHPLRLLMGSKFVSQALPLRGAEAPFVQSAVPGVGKSFENVYGMRVGGAVAAEAGGRVLDVTDTGITIKDTKGNRKTYELYSNFPFNRKSYIHSVPQVRPGDMVRPGQIIASSNYTDGSGTLAFGRNMRIAFLPYLGYNYEDAIVISDAAAGALSSEHMYKHTVKSDEDVMVDRNKYISIFPANYDQRQVLSVGRDGVVKPGTIVKKGDPLILATAERKPTGEALHQLYKRSHIDRSVEWEHDYPAVVTDTMSEGGRVTVLTKAYVPAKIADKLAARAGNKGVIADIVPVDRMPKTKDGRPLDVLLNPMGILTRLNSGQVIEAALGKVVEKTGVPYVLPGFIEGSWIDFAKEELRKNGLKDTEDIIDPQTGRTIPDVFVGNMYIMKLLHTAETKEAGRDIDFYTSEMVPARGGPTGSKRLGTMECNALLSHGAFDVFKDAKLIRGQRNDEFWKAFRLGLTPPMPRIPFIHDKFVAYLKGAGINVERSGNFLNIMALTDSDTKVLSKGEIELPQTIDAKTLRPLEKGLFDPGITGGAAGSGWGHISLSEPIPNPVMEDVIKSVLNLTQKEFEEVVAGKRRLHGEIGGKALRNALRDIRVDQEMEKARIDISGSSASRRDRAIKKLRYLEMFRKTGIDPKELIWSSVPVVPPAFRPITAYKGMQFVSDANLLYQDVMQSNENLKELSAMVGPDQLGGERLALYNSVKALTGLASPSNPKLRQKHVKGLLEHVLGGSPKWGMVQYKMLGTAVDVVGRSAITPNPSLDMDHVGLPENVAWVVYRPFVIRRLVRKGIGRVEAARMVADRSKEASDALLQEMGMRPVIINRAPTLHKFGLMAAFPVITTADTLQIPPILTKSFGADFDGDAMNYHLPVSEEARKEAIDKMLPSRNLLSLADFDVHYVPQHEYLYGLHLASRKKSNRPEKRFASVEDVMNAFERGEVSVDQIVNVAGT